MYRTSFSLQYLSVAHGDTEDPNLLGCYAVPTG